MAPLLKRLLNKKVIQSKQDNKQAKEVSDYPQADVERLPLVVIVGPTASGKSATAMRIAKEFHGEIICADSRTIYRGMDIGTAKPTSEDREEVPHWGLDLVEPGEVFTAADFKKYALQKANEIQARGHLPMLVGGT
ncbi:MAG TPA: isopentenyl transferase family protein, partial [Dongiaceae bacterium]|nr:isopentenyl transferase family protein [Dongiaceae bacterium]